MSSTNERIRATLKIVASNQGKDRETLMKKGANLSLLCHAVNTGEVVCRNGLFYTKHAAPAIQLPQVSQNSPPVTSSWFAVKWEEKRTKVKLPPKPAEPEKTKPTEQEEIEALLQKLKIEPDSLNGSIDSAKMLALLRRVHFYQLTGDPFTIIDLCRQCGVNRRSLARRPNLYKKIQALAARFQKPSKGQIEDRILRAIAEAEKRRGKFSIRHIAKEFGFNERNVYRAHKDLLAKLSSLRDRSYREEYDRRSPEEKMREAYEVLKSEGKPFTLSAVRSRWALTSSSRKSATPEWQQILALKRKLEERNS